MKRIKMESEAADLRLLDKVEGGWPAERGWTRVRRNMFNNHYRQIMLRGQRDTNTR